MKLKVFESKLNGSITAPPSKSHSIRAVILAGFAIGNSNLQSILNSDDVLQTINCMHNLGVNFNIEKQADGSTLNIKVLPPKNGLIDYLNKKPEQTLNIDAGNSGSLFYFLASILCFLDNKTIIFTGDKSLSSRPITPTLEIYNKFNIEYQANKNDTLPLKVFSHKLDHSASLNLTLDGKFSQPISGLLMSMAIFNHKLNLQLNTVGEKPYLQMTIKWLEKMGVEFNTPDFENARFSIKHTEPIAGFNKTIYGDWSSASFLIVAAVITNSELTVENLNSDDTQGDKEICSLLNKMGANITLDNNTVIIKKHNGLKSQIIDCDNTPDLLPILALALCFANGTSKIINAEICRFKECDRIHISCTELKKLGARIEETQDGLIIDGMNTLHPVKNITESYHDHRIAMMLIIAGLSIKSPIVVNNYECFRISYPTFLENLKAIGGNYIIGHL